MKLTVPFSYDIEYVVKRKRTVSTTTAFLTTDVEIAPAAGPVKLAFELGCPLLEEHGHNSHELPDRSVFYAPPGETVKTYRAEDAYWVEICEADEAPGLIANRAKMPRDPFSVFYGSDQDTFLLSLAHRKEAKSRLQIEMAHEEEGGLRRWDEDGKRGRSATELLIRRRATYDLREIDGKLCMRVSEPALGFFFHAGNEENANKSALEKGSYVIVEQSERETPAGFSLKWDLRPWNVRRWRIDELPAAVAFAESLTENGPRELKGSQVQFGHVDTSDCLFEGSKTLLEDAIEQLRKIVVERHLAQMNGAELSTILDLQHVFERDAGRLSPEYIELARQLLELIERDERSVVPPLRVRMAMRKGIGYGSHHFAGDRDVAAETAARNLRAALKAFDARPRDGRDWIDRALPCGVLAGKKDLDVIEVLTMRDGQRLIDAGCDRAVIPALTEASHGQIHVICMENAQAEVRPFAGVMIEEDGVYRLDRIIGPPGNLGRKLEAEYRDRFEAWAVHASQLFAEDQNLASLAL